jgi:hypothetical protein
VYAIRPGASGDISLEEGASSNAFIVWANRLLGSYNTSALVYGDYYYTLLDRGLLLAHDARTGKEVYGRQRIAADASGFTASPWAYNGKIFAVSEDGDTFVMAAGPAFIPGRTPRRHGAGHPPLPGSLFIRTSQRYRIARGCGEGAGMAAGAAPRSSVSWLRRADRRPNPAGSIPGPADLIEADRYVRGAGKTLSIIDVADPAAPARV